MSRPLGGIRNLADGLSRQARARPDATAIHLPAGALSFLELETLAWRGATLLSRSGVRPGDVLALACADELALIIALIAGARIGATLVSISLGAPRLVQEETAQAAGARFFVADRATLGEQWQPMIFFDLMALAQARAPIDFGVRDASPLAPWLIISGSGSTGKAKMIPIGHAQFAGRMSIYNTALSISPSDRVASLFPLAYATPKQRCLEALFGGAGLVLFARGANDPIRQIQQAQVSVLYSTVPHAEKLLKCLPEDASAVLTALRVFMVGSSVVSPGLRVRIQKSLTPNLFVYYGMNEFGLATLAAPADQGASLETVGRPPKGVVIEVVDPGGQVLPKGEIGLIRGKSPAMGVGYLNDEAATRRAFVDGWFYSGDLGRFTEDGNLLFCGRSDHMMNMNGINIYPAEIETVLTRHPAVHDAAAAPLKHPVHQDIPICAVVFHQGQEASEEELLAFASQRLGARSPGRIVVLQKIPRNEQGKLIRPQLLLEIGERLGLHALRHLPPAQ